jgi:hypothetical protein
MKIKTRACLLVGLMSLAAASIAADAPSDEAGFTNFVAARLRGQVSDADVVVKGPLTLGLGDRQLNLDRSQHAPLEKKAVRLVIRTEDYVTRARAVPAGTKGIDMEPRPFIEGLHVLPVIDSPRTVRT